tara:strand:- start:163 stop:1317 length:1155 start_codon:yes stop_codon:yes gene_type:complete
VCDVRDGTHDSPKYIDKGFPLITSKNLKNGRLNFEKIKYISEADYNSINKRSKVDVGDILFAMIGTIGNPVLIKNQPNYAIKNVALFKKKSNDVLMTFFEYFLVNPIVIDKMTNEAKGATQKFVGLNYLRAFKITLPPLEEQKRIVAKIDTLFAKIDKAISLTEESLVQAKNLLPSVLKEVFDRLSIKNENVELSNICTFKNGFAFKSKEFNKTGEGNQVIRIGNVLDVQKNQVFIKENPIYNAYLLNENDIIISMTGTRKKKDYLFVRIIKDESSYLNQRVGRISVNSTTHHSYIYYYLKSDMFRSKVFEYETGAVNQGNISGSAIMKMLIPKVDFEKQIEIGAICSNLSEKAKQTQSKLEEQLAYLKQLKSSILSKAFKGEL